MVFSKCDSDILLRNFVSTDMRSQLKVAHWRWKSTPIKTYSGLNQSDSALSIWESCSVETGGQGPHLTGYNEGKPERPDTDFRLEQVRGILTLTRYLVLLLGSTPDKLRLGWWHGFALATTVLAEGYSVAGGRPYRQMWTSGRCSPGTDHLRTNALTLPLAASPNCCFPMITHLCLPETNRPEWQYIRTRRVTCRKAVAPVMHLDFAVVCDIHPRPAAPQLQSRRLLLPAGDLPL